MGVHYDRKNYDPEQEIISRDLKRINYRQMIELVGRLASGLAGPGVEPGAVVAVLDWDLTAIRKTFSPSR